MDKIFYNQASAAKLGWEPSWFGAEEFDEELIENIMKEYEVARQRLMGSKL